MFHPWFTTVFLVPAMFAGSASAQVPHAHSSGAVRGQTAIAVNDNRRPAGSLANGILTLELRARSGVWRPEGDAGREFVVAAFADGSSLPSVPAPLVRVPEGTTIVATIRNELERVLTVHGLCDRGQASCPPVDVPSGGTSELRFSSGPAGTYHYWATTDRVPLGFRPIEDAQLSGPFVVDPREGTRADDRVFVITEWADVTRDQLHYILAQDDPGAAFIRLRPDVLFTINGQSWPHGEQLAYRVGDRVRWRIVNLSSQVHPSHVAACGQGWRVASRQPPSARAGEADHRGGGDLRLRVRRTNRPSQPVDRGAITRWQVARPGAHHREVIREGSDLDFRGRS